MNIRHGIRVRGTVQGVGFRPAVYRAAANARLSGFVRNDAEGVWIEVEGAPAAVEEFPDRLLRALPPLARIDAIEIEPRAPTGDDVFLVRTSRASGAVRAAIPADIATCAACVRELFDPKDRRYRYPFINCTDCGPRYTIVRDLPYDRAKTTMAVFAMCEACRAEYEDPLDRRFHAEPIACANCGPSVTLMPDGARGDAAVERACQLLRLGRVVAVKGLGGWQLACDARDEAAVARLRARKLRPHKPFAVMTADPSALVVLDAPTLAALRDPSQPIVLAPSRGEVAPSVAPRLGELGVMLPTTPLHHLLLANGPPALVMTSGNLADEPIAIDDDDAYATLGPIADAFLGHDRAIHTRADDSVGRVVHGHLSPIRRGRGWAPAPISLGPDAKDAPPILAVGAEVKNAVCLTRGDEAFVSQHIGDLSGPKAQAFFEESIAKLGRLLGVVPRAVAHDLHPDYAATRWAKASGLTLVAVQHHHAHVASCLVDNGVTGPAIGVAFDGTGCGPAGDAWGGEILTFDLEDFSRVFHLRPLALPGGEAAIREPWRLGVAALVDAGEGLELERFIHAGKILPILDKRGLSPRATGAGRWFDAVSAILGMQDAISYEAQAAIELEALADRSCDVPYAFAFEGDEIDLRPAIRALVRDEAPVAASRFHSTLAEAIRDACLQIRSDRGLDVVALSGGCFQNAMLTERTVQRLTCEGFRVLVHRRVPPNDGGLALGQAAIAARRLNAMEKEGRDVSRHPG